MSSNPKLDRKYGQKGIGGAAALLILVILAIIGGGVWFGFITIKTTPPTQSSTAPTPPPSLAGTSYWVGDVTPSIRGTDTLIETTSYQCGSALTCRWFYNRSPGTGMPVSGFISTAITGNSTFYLDPLDKGIIYLEILSNAPAVLLQDVKRTLNTYTGRVLDFAYINIDSDTPKEMVYKINAVDIRPSAGGSTAASLSFALWMANYQVVTFAYNKPTSSPETGIGTAANQTRIVVEYTFANTGRVYPINNLRIRINGSESLYTIDSIKVPVYGSNGFTILELGQASLTKEVSTFTASTGATTGGNTQNVTWTKTLCTEINCFHTSPYATIYSTSTTKTFSIEILITFKLPASAIRFIQVGIEALDDDETVITGKYAVRYFRA
ncbi:MAG: hypothetical protein AAB922_03780 [Patescibacteria group bacterium]